MRWLNKLLRLLHSSPHYIIDYFQSGEEKREHCWRPSPFFGYCEELKTPPFVSTSCHPTPPSFNPLPPLFCWLFKNLTKYVSHNQNKWWKHPWSKINGRKTFNPNFYFIYLNLICGLLMRWPVVKSQCTLPLLVIKSVPKKRGRFIGGSVVNKNNKDKNHHFPNSPNANLS